MNREDNHTDPTWRSFQASLSAAMSAFAQGDSGPFKAHWSHTPEASILGAFGGHQRGWEQIEPRLDWAAAHYTGGTQQDETLVEQIGSVLAYTVRLERITTMSPDGPIERRRRVTAIYTKHAGEWRVLHFHADPLVDTTTPGID
jgi:hypothetical protein